MKISEDLLQAQCVRWFRLQYPDKIIFAIPNGGMRNKIVAAKLKRGGVLPGVPDLCVPHPIYDEYYSTLAHGLYIEMKIKGNKLTDLQHNILNLLNKLGYITEVCYTFEEFQKAVKRYFSD